MVGRSFDVAMLAALRRMPAAQVLQRVAIRLKSDPTYVPRKNRESRRWHVLTVCADFEILTTGCRWFDTRERRGGASAIDLAMHLLGVSFVEGVKFLAGGHPTIGTPLSRDSGPACKLTCEPDQEHSAPSLQEDAGACRDDACAGTRYTG